MSFLNKRNSLRMLSALLVSSLAVSCDLIKQPKTDARGELPVEFRPSSENGGRQCLPIYYGLGEGDGTHDPKCFDLQVQLAEASSAGDIQRIKGLLASGANADSKAGDHYYPLRAAAANGQTEAAHVLLDNGANVNYWHPIHGFPLLDAADNGKTETVQLLLSRGADVSLESDSYTALRVAREKGFQDIVSLLKLAGATR